MASATSTPPERIELMAHQREGIAFLVSKKAGLVAFEQGLGKTLVAIKAFMEVRASGGTDALLVLCPNSLKRNWAAEFARAEPDIDIVIVEGSAKNRRRLCSMVTAPAKPREVSKPTDGSWSSSWSSFVTDTAASGERPT